MVWCFNNLCESTPEGTTMENQFGWWLPLNISTHGAGIDQLINLLHWFMGLLFVGWGIFLVYCLIRFRERPGHQADVTVKHFKLPVILEVAVLLFEIVLLVFISSPIWFSFKTEFPEEKDALVVRVVGEQFAWNIHYPGKDGIFGPTKLELIDGTNPVGLDREAPEAKDDILTINNLHVPVNKKVIVHLSSKDVIHNFFIPVMRVKQDMIPGIPNRVWFEATQTGEYEIACAQLCGIGHYRMRGQFFVDSPEAFDKFMAEEAAALASEMGEVPTASAPETATPPAETASSEEGSQQ